MINFKEKARIAKEADNALDTILSKKYDTFEQHKEENKITDLEIAKLIIKRLLDKLNNKLPYESIESVANRLTMTIISKSM